ncbi:hypothetical protein QN219_23540 [Sinorhizobium sp. 7-81]|uniref:hypothetical protein n=1 Tax=unclassified Sinorhizobium TaxID=2613772 RepID=UPI0024C32CF9|nr:MULTISPECIES: hypothetical protein [unclassified Sinorhizobium]MDK1389348.1 hypothetical protein [Sinorhizobium sp. 7-81]MDK1492990.1 hypothetical protein [Sinorhizobium sp. 8-89]
MNAEIGFCLTMALMSKAAKAWLSVLAAHKPDHICPATRLTYSSRRGAILSERRAVL